MFGIFGRSQEMQRLDRTFRAASLDSRAVPEAVKLTTLKELKNANFGRNAELRDYEAASELIAYCVLGPEIFCQANGANRTEAIEARMVDALATGYGLDSRLVLLTMYAKLIHSTVVEKYQLASE